MAGKKKESKLKSQEMYERKYKEKFPDGYRSGKNLKNLSFIPQKLFLQFLGFSCL